MPRLFTQQGIIGDESKGGLIDQSHFPRFDAEALSLVGRIQSGLPFHRSVKTEEGDIQRGGREVVSIAAQAVPGIGAVCLFRRLNRTAEG